MNRLQGKTVLATACGQGIGKATALRMAQEGGRVFATDIDGDALEAIADTPGIETRILDATDKDAIKSLVSQGCSTLIIYIGMRVVY